MARLPAYGPEREVCTTTSMSLRGGKGMFAKGKPAGLFFPHEPEETWHLVEGPKDAYPDLAGISYYGFTLGASGVCHRSGIGSGDADWRGRVADAGPDFSTPDAVVRDLGIIIAPSVRQVEPSCWRVPSTRRA